MNREDILSMVPGQELDALVAEKVMGRLVTWNRLFQYITDEEKKSDNRSFVNIPEFSADISAAWEVVEKFPISKVVRVEVFVGNVTINVTLYPTTDSDKSYTASSNSFALSACKAALLAVTDE